MGKRRIGWAVAAVGVLLITAVPASAGEEHQPAGQQSTASHQTVSHQTAGHQFAGYQSGGDQPTGLQVDGLQTAGSQPGGYPPDGTQSAGHGADYKSGDQAAFDKLHERQAKAWAEEDGAAFAATYTEQGDVVTFNGEHLHSREGIARGMQYYFDNYIDGSRIKRLSEKVRYLDRNTVVIIRSSCLTQGDVPDCRPDSHSTNTNLLVRRHGQWLQESFQNTRYFEIP